MGRFQCQERHGCDRYEQTQATGNRKAGPPNRDAVRKVCQPFVHQYIGDGKSNQHGQAQHIDQGVKALLLEGSERRADVISNHNKNMRMVTGLPSLRPIMYQ